MKIVLDTNVLVSALIKEGKPRTLVFEIIRRKHKITISREVLDEFAEVAAEPEMRKYVSEQDISRFLRDIGSVSEIVGIKSKFRVIKEDPADDIILRTCYDGKARYIVSGDKHLLKLKRFRRTKIVTVDEMLKFLRARTR